jgi:hypothetical protein
MTDLDDSRPSLVMRGRSLASFFRKLSEFGTGVLSAVAKI